MGSGHACWLNAVNSLRLPRVQPDLLGLLCWARTLCHRVSSIRGGIGVATWRSSRGDFGTDACHCVGARPVLSRPDDFELEILLHRAVHFFNRDYGVFDCGGVALSKAKLRLMSVYAFELGAMSQRWATASITPFRYTWLCKRPNGPATHVEASLPIRNRCYSQTGSRPYRKS
jgi:hypothetical protein